MQLAHRILQERAADRAQVEYMQKDIESRDQAGVSGTTIDSPETMLATQLARLLDENKKARETQGPTSNSNRGTQGVSLPDIPYSGNETPGKNEVDFEAWAYEVRAWLETHPESIVKKAMIWSLKEPAYTVMRSMPTNATVEQIIARMEQRCDPVIDIHIMWRNFNDIQQNSKESAASYVNRLETALLKIKSKYPQAVEEDKIEHTMKAAFFQGLKSSLKRLSQVFV